MSSSSIREAAAQGGGNCVARTTETCTHELDVHTCMHYSTTNEISSFFFVRVNEIHDSSLFYFIESERVYFRERV